MQIINFCTNVLFSLDRQIGCVLVSAMDIKDIATRNNVSQRFAYYVSRGERYTDNIGLAFDMAAAFGAKPINYIRPGLRSVFKKHVPAINKKVRL